MEGSATVLPGRPVISSAAHTATLTAGCWSGAHADILAVTALPGEFCTATETLDAKRRNCVARVEISDRADNLWLVELVLINSSGSVHAALETQDALRRTSAKHVVLLGTAAGIPGKVQLGDVVVPEQIVYYEGQKVVDTIEQTAPAWKGTDPRVRRSASISSRLAGLATALRDVHVHTDLVMASGEKVIASEAFRERLVSTHRKLGALDMESYGVACAAERRGVRFNVIKGISDFADSTKNDDCQERAVTAATLVFRGLVVEGAFRTADEDG